MGRKPSHMEFVRVRKFELPSATVARLWVNMPPTSFTHALGERGYNISDTVLLLSANFSAGTSIF